MAFLRRILPYTSLVLLIAAIYTGWIFFSRWRDQKQAETEAKTAESERDVAVAKLYGDRVKIMGFYGNPGTVRPGERALVCYSVTNAQSIVIEPTIEDNLKPSLSRCLEVHPRKDTEYKLTAKDAQGHSDQQSFVLHVASPHVASPHVAR